MRSIVLLCRTYGTYDIYVPHNVGEALIKRVEMDFISYF